MKVSLYYIAIIGWVITVIIHILSWVGIDVGQNTPLFGLLQIGVGIVWIATLMGLKNTHTNSTLR